MDSCPRLSSGLESTPPELSESIPSPQARHPASWKEQPHPQRLSQVTSTESIHSGGRKEKDDGLSLCVANADDELSPKISISISQRLDGPPETPTEINAMGVSYSVQSPSSTGDEPFYGQSSIACLQNQLPGKSAGLNSSTEPISAHRQAKKRILLDCGRTFDGETNAVASKFHQFSLPPRSVADHLIEQYWARCHDLYPWFHGPSFHKAYEALWRRREVSNESRSSQDDTSKRPRIGLGGRDCSPSVFHCALNAIFALGCEFSPTVDHADEPGREFMGRVYDLLQIRLLDHASLALVQTLLLVSNYLQSTAYPMRCWGVVGLACRMAQGIGLHLNHSGHSAHSTIEIEMRRRVWHGCVLMDR